MANVRTPSAVFTPFTIKGSRNESIPIVLVGTFTFQSRRRSFAVCGVIFDSPRCQASRAGSPLEVVHSAPDCPSAECRPTVMTTSKHQTAKTLGLDILVELRVESMLSILDRAARSVENLESPDMGRQAVSK